MSRKYNIHKQCRPSRARLLVSLDWNSNFTKYSAHYSPSNIYLLGMTCICSVLVLLILLVLSGFLYFSQSRVASGHGYILLNKVRHYRFLPAPSKHSFTFPTIFLLLSLRALESHSLDLFGGFVFGYGGLFFRLTGIRPNGYLMPDKQGEKKRSILQKLITLLHERDVKVEVEDVWMMTMPSYLAWEGINPLTVYFIYNPQCQCCLVVLEVRPCLLSSC
jgi:hypothetical protein